MRAIPFLLAGFLFACEETEKSEIEEEEVQDENEEGADSDGDGVNDDEDAFPEDPDESADSDEDGVGDNADAFPEDPNETTDSDEDGVGDNADAFPEDPNETVDTDSDGIGDNRENTEGWDPNSPDSDGDGLEDGEELDLGTDPGNADSDNDGLEDGDELDEGTDPNNVDTDGDGATDGQEIAEGTDPNDPNSGGAEPVIPEIGDWLLQNTATGVDSCGLTGALSLAGMSLTDVLPDTVKISNATASSFSGEIRGQTATCIVTGNTFNCGQINLTEPFAVSQFNIAFDLTFSVGLSGIMSDTENMDMTMTADVASCTDTDGFSCSLLSTFGVTIPCVVSMTGEASLQ